MGGCDDLRGSWHFSLDLGLGVLLGKLGDAWVFGMGLLGLCVICDNQSRTWSLVLCMALNLGQASRYIFTFPCLSLPISFFFWSSSK